MNRESVASRSVDRFYAEGIEKAIGRGSANAYGAILIPGGGLTERGRVPPWVESRLDAAIALCRYSKFIITQSKGSTHKEPVVIDGQTITEAEAGKRYLIQKGVDALQILKEEESLDTIGNAYFARLIARQKGQVDLLTITSQFQMPRVSEVYNWVFGLPYDHGDTSKYVMSFLTTPNRVDHAEIVDARADREIRSINRFLREWVNEIRTFLEFEEALFKKHDAYREGGSNLSRVSGTTALTY